MQRIENNLRNLDENHEFSWIHIVQINNKLHAIMRKHDVNGNMIEVVEVTGDSISQVMYNLDVELERKNA